MDIVTAVSRQEEGDPKGTRHCGRATRNTESSGNKGEDQTSTRQEGREIKNNILVVRPVNMCGTDYFNFVQSGLC